MCPSECGLPSFAGRSACGDGENGEEEGLFTYSKDLICARAGWLGGVGSLPVSNKPGPLIFPNFFGFSPYRSPSIQVPRRPKSGRLRPTKNATAERSGVKKRPLVEIKSKATIENSHVTSPQLVRSNAFRPAICRGRVLFRR